MCRWPRRPSCPSKIVCASQIPPSQVICSTVAGILDLSQVTLSTAARTLDLLQVALLTVGRILDLAQTRFRRDVQILDLSDVIRSTAARMLDLELYSVSVGTKLSPNSSSQKRHRRTFNMTGFRAEPCKRNNKIKRCFSRQSTLPK